ncbi:O-antigen ligase [Gordonia sp. CNJ-863]|uniref:O-antigen ligase family protein n=1 Tax=Gordonia sp. CNJ-863 TaxID=1904963 RepID=UPI0013012805|nr:O-antigen ligase family protein [Gordonia sp. CNJ-863]
MLTVAAAIGAAQTPLVLAGLAGMLVLVLACVFPSSWWNLVPATALVVTPQVLSGDPATPIPNADAAQKGVLILALLGLLLTLGFRFSVIGSMALAVIALSGLAAVLNAGGEIAIGGGGIARSAVGFALPWLFLFVDWSTLGLARGLKFLAALPTLCLIAGLVLTAAGISPVIVREWGGALRLQGSAVPAHLAMLAFVGLVAGLVALVTTTGVPRWWAYAIPALNMMILLGTATRGAITAAAVVVVTFVISALRSRSSTGPGRRAAWLLLAAVAVGGVAAGGQIMLRNRGNSYEGSFNTSGRDQAWQFFFDAAMANPVTGRGLGFSSIAVETLNPRNVQSAFIAPHNQYLHLFVDGGFFLAVGLFGALAAAVWWAAASQIETGRAVVVAFGISIVFYSFIDNTLSAPQFSVTTMILLGLLGTCARGTGPVANHAEHGVETRPTRSQSQVDA